MSAPPEAPGSLVAAPDALAQDDAGRRVIRGSALRSAAHVTGILLGLVSVPLVTRHLGVADYGRFVTVSSLIFIVSGITEAGLTNVGVREYATGDRASRQRLIGNLLALRLVMTALGVVLAVGFALVAGYPAVMVHGTLLMGAGLLLASAQFTLAVPLSAELRLGWVALVDLLRAGVTTALMAALAVLGAGLGAFYAVSIAAAAAALAVTALVVRRGLSVAPRADRREWRRLLGETVVYAAASALGIVYFQLAVVLMSLLASPAQTGYFSVAFRIQDIANGIPWLLVSSIFPLLAHAAARDQDRLRHALQRLFEVGVIVGTWFSLATVVGAPFAVDVVGGSRFAPAVDVLRIAAVGMVATFLWAAWAFALLSLRRHRELLIANGAAVLVAAALNLVLIPPLEAEGAALAILVTELVLAGTYLVLLVRARPDLRVSPRILPRVTVAAALGAASALALPAPAVVEAIVASALYFAVLVALRALPPELSAALRRR